MHYRSLAIGVATVKTGALTCTALDALETLTSVLINMTKLPRFFVLCTSSATPTTYCRDLFEVSFRLQTVFDLG